MGPPSAVQVRRRAWQRMHVSGAHSPLLLKPLHLGDGGWLLLCLCLRSMRVWLRADDGPAFAAFRRENNAKLSGDAAAIQHAITAVLVGDGAASTAVVPEDDEDAPGELLLTAVDRVSAHVHLSWPITLAAVTGRAARKIVSDHVVRPLLGVARLHAAQKDVLANALPSERAARLLAGADEDAHADGYSDVAALTDAPLYERVACEQADDDAAGTSETATAAAAVAPSPSPSPLHVSATISTGDAASLLDFEDAADDVATTESASAQPSADMTAHEEQSAGELAAQLERKRQLEEKLARERRKKAKRAKKGPTFV